MMSLTFGLFTQVSGSGPLGPLVKILFHSLSHCIFSIINFHQSVTAFFPRFTLGKKEEKVLNHRCEPRFSFKFVSVAAIGIQHIFLV